MRFSALAIVWDGGRKPDEGNSHLVASVRRGETSKSCAFGVSRYVMRCESDDTRWRRAVANTVGGRVAVSIVGWGLSRRERLCPRLRQR